MSQMVKISALLMSSALLMIAGGMHGLILPVRGAEEGFSLLALGLIGTGWSIGFISGSISVPHLVRRVGHIRAYAVMAAIACMTILLNLIFIHDAAWIFLRIFSGFCFAGAAMVVESWLNEVSDNESRGTTFSIYVSVTLFASTAGQMVIAVTGVAGFIPFVLAAIAYIAAVLPTAVTRTPQPAPLQTVSLDVVVLYKTSPIAVVAAFSVGMANGAFGTLAPVYGIERGFSTATIAYLISLAIVAGAIAQVPLGRLSDRIDRRKVMMGVAIIGAVAGLLTIVFNPGENALLYLLFALYGLAAYSLYAIAVAHANDFADDGSFAKIASGMLLVLGSGQMLGPIVASLTMQWMGPVALFMVPVAFHGALAATAFFRMRIRDAAPAEDRAPFQAMPSERLVTGETLNLDPRSEENEFEFDENTGEAPATEGSEPQQG
ncbi:MFS transporter [Pelagibacterium nitratireducens]|uniref:MFS transporter n=1 Tax=Pelagibacterium nitratireducens TaxID=1046114 RepID=A0ABZ2I1F1_9HYPH|tara:strand:+ start:3800 stop:5101 length:1302 start_codon:yes stop_codon:yes gene_type:complete